MDFNQLVKNVNNVDQYISLTQEINDKNKNTKVQINITTVLALNKIKSLEIEYLIKCYENGAACIIFERLLKLPPSKAWGALGKELVSILKYWLEAIRKYLINHSVHWWSFLKVILKYFKEMYQKDPSMPDILVELAVEDLLDIVTRDNTDTYQRHEILHCLNVFCAESSREIRFAMRNKFSEFFTKLAFQLAHTPYLPCQYSSLETLMRWLVPRQDPNLRAAAAACWFPANLYPDSSKKIFITTKWMDCFQDARDFLNALNEEKGLVHSVVCRRLTIGKTIIISGAEKHQSWLDINSGVKCISVLLGPKVSESIGNGKLDRRACESLVISDEDTQTVRLSSDSQELKISLTTYNPPRVLPSGIVVGEANDVTLCISSRADVTKLDAALRNVFAEKYYLQMDLNSELSLSPPRSRDVRRNCNSSEEDTRFSHPVELNRRKHGVLVKSRDAAGLASPSTASTSSLAQLHDRLAALPRYRFDKEPVSVCAQPQLSSVTEISEPDINKYRPSGFRHKKLISIPPKDTKRRAESDSETLKLKFREDRQLSPVLSDENSASCLLVATLGSADDTVINETVQRLSKSKDFKSENIVDLLIQEALQSGPIAKEKLVDSGINSSEKKSLENEEENSEAIDNTPGQNDDKKSSKKSRVLKKKICTVVSKSTTDDESNTEAINDTPVYTNVKNRNRRQTIFKATEEPEVKVTDKSSFDVQAVEQFFSQHFAETKAGEIVISPSLAKKINESSSDASENFDENYLLMNEPINADIEQFEFNNIDIVECLNDMVDKVCADFKKCTQKKNKSTVMEKEIGTALGVNILKVSKEPTTVSAQQKERPTKLKRGVKLTFKAKEYKKKVSKKKNKNEIQPEPTKKMSIIIEQHEEEIQATSSPKSIVEEVSATKIDSPVIKEYNSPADKGKTTSAVKRKRKLYSPKDDDAKKNREEMVLSQTEDDDVVLAKLKTYPTRKNQTSTSCATCYKDIEQERQKRIRLPRSKKGRGKVEESPSPKTLKMNAVFDKLKATVESKEQIVLANKNLGQSNVYNFTSESEDEDFQQKKVAIQKRTSNTTLGSFESATPKRRGRPRTRQNYSEISSNEDVKAKTVKKKRTVKKTNSKIKNNIESVIELNDERMRKAGPEELDSSIVVQKPKTKKPNKAVLDLHKTPEMEPIDDQEITATVKRKLSKRSAKKTENQAVKKEKSSVNKELVVISDKEDDRTVSPLPGLVVESAPAHKDDANDSVTTIMVQKFKKLYQEDPDGTNESSNTQNLLLSDIDRCNSPQIVTINITDEVYLTNYPEENTATKVKGKKVQKKSSKKINQNVLDKTKLSFHKNIRDDIIEIPEELNTNSEKSIATVGITAHGDFDEEPPSPELIRKHLQPREIEDLNESMRDYYVKLNDEIYDSAPKDRRESSKSKEALEVSHIRRPVVERSPSVNSPVVSVKRLSFDDINQWIPSRRTSDTSSEKSSLILQKKSFEEQNKQLALVHNTNKMSEDVKGRTNADENTNKSSVVQKKTECIHELPTPKKPSAISKWNDFINVTDCRLNTTKYNTKNTSALDQKQINKNDTESNNNNESKAKNSEKTTAIKSVKSFGTFRANKADYSYLGFCEQQIEKVIPNQKDNTKKDAAKPTQKTSRSKSLTKFILDPSQDSITPVQSQSSQAAKEKVSVSSTKTEDLCKFPIKRKSSPVFREPKIRKSQANVDTSTIASARSAGSLSDWLKQLETSSITAQDTRLTFRDLIQNIMEKLDTTLVENNRNTSKKLANLFIEAQNKLTEQQAEFQKMYKITTKEVMAEMASILNKKFMEMNAKYGSEQIQADFKEHLKMQAFELIREDCKQKRVMVLLLKEDVQAVLDHIEKGGE